MGLHLLLALECIDKQEGAIAALTDKIEALENHHRVQTDLIIGLQSGLAAAVLAVEVSERRQSRQAAEEASKLSTRVSSQCTALQNQTQGDIARLQRSLADVTKELRDLKPKK